jgi:hypothetical protein
MLLFGKKNIEKSFQHGRKNSKGDFVNIRKVLVQHEKYLDKNSDRFFLHIFEYCFKGDTFCVRSGEILLRTL